MSAANRAIVELDTLSKRFDTEAAVEQLTLDIVRGEFLTLLGPSGCGKTTTLRCIAGLERVDSGEIRLEGKVVASAERNIHVNPEHRNIGMVFQSYAVWPHMSVFDNVAYGLRVRGKSGLQLKQRTMKALEIVGLHDLANRYATRLSGGQRQRVALARAIVYEPNVILFDEPLSNLDAKLREQMRVELVRLQRELGITSIYVTHDQTEALAMSDRVVVMNKGLVQQVGAPREIYGRPANCFVAGFIGACNMLQATVCRQDGKTCELEVSVGNNANPLRLHAITADGHVLAANACLCVRPEDVALSVERPNGSSVNVIEATVIDTVYLGSFLECRVQAGERELRVQVNHCLPLAPRQKVFLTFRPEHSLCLAQ